MKYFLLFPALLAGVEMLHASENPASAYPGVAEIRQLGGDLYAALPPEARRNLPQRPIYFENNKQPAIRLIDSKGEPNTLRAVQISVGLVDLVNQVAHAKAIDNVEPGYLARYASRLAHYDGKAGVPLPDNIMHRKYWTEEILNDQRSNFNQITGALIAMELAHFYQDYYPKLAQKMAARGSLDTATPGLLSPEEWRKSLRAGVQNALNCGLGVEGLIGLFECIEKMPSRPSWAASFFPPHANLKETRKDLGEIERRFLGGKRR